MEPVRRLKAVAVGLMGLHSGSNYRMAGVARTSLRIFEALADEFPDTRFVAYIAGTFEPTPELLARKNVEFRQIRKFRTFEAIGGLLARAVGCQVWYTPGYDGLRFSFIPQVTLVHDMFPFTHPEWFETEINEHAKANIARQIAKSKALIANSQATMEETERIFPGSAARCTVVPLALGNVIGSQVGVPESEGVPFRRYILAVGTLEPRKNLPALFRAWGEVVRSGRHPDVGLVVAGGKGWGDEDHRRTLRELGIEGRVHFAGYVPDESLPSLFAAAELFVMPSLDEGFGIPALEAMAYGAPVLSSDAGALREVGGEAARYFAPTDESAMARAIADALDRPGERAAWVAKGRERAKEFGWEKTARATYDVLARCV